MQIWVFKWKILVYFMDIWLIDGLTVYFLDIWSIYGVLVCIFYKKFGPFMVFGYILWTFGPFMVFWYILWTFGPFMVFGYILWTFGPFMVSGIFYGHLVHLAVIWWFFSRFGILHQEKSGNPGMYLIGGFERK
jgi:hypothetical protein